MSDSKKQIESASHLDWDDSGRPISKLFNDFYFSTLNSIDESRHIFLNSNNLSERWKVLGTGDDFTIGETGFGCGLNFLSCWQAWQENAPSGAHLHYISAEKHPLSVAELSSIHKLWPELEQLGSQLLALYPASYCGIHRLHFPKDNISLTLLLGDANEMYNSIQASIDCWFLDGFAPSKNPEMWQPALFETMASMSNDSTTLSTYTVARNVRLGLIKAGFDVIKDTGFGNKKELSRGKLKTIKEPVDTQIHEASHATFHSKRGAVSPWERQPASTSKKRHVTIIGAGLAGCSCALAMARRGWQVTLLESNSQPAVEASGNPQGILYSKLSAHGTHLSELVHQGFHYSIALLQQLLPPEHNTDAWSPCGVIQLAHNKKEQERQLELIESDLSHPEFFNHLSAEQLSVLSGVKVEHSGLHFPRAGWVNPASFCSAVLQHPNISLQTDWTLTQLEPINNQAGWLLINQNGVSLTSDTVIIASGKESSQLPQSSYLPLKAIRGQISYLPETTASNDLKSVLCAEGYIAPARKGFHNFGATFNFDNITRDCRDVDHMHNLEKLNNLSSELYQHLNASMDNLQGGRANFRCTTPDYLPLVGAICDSAAFIERFAHLRKDSKYRFETPCPFLPGLYVSTAHGSRGLISCPLSGEILASIICNEPLPISNVLFNALNPNRFLVRQLIRQKI